MHVTRLHGNQNKHFCVECTDSFPTQTQLGHHIVNRHSEASIACANPQCTLKFKNSTTHKTHYVRCHLKANQLYVRRPDKTCKCLSCGDLFTLNAVIYHVSGCSPHSPFSKNILQVPNEMVPIEQPCQLCPQTFPTQTQLSHHIVSQHSNTRLHCAHPDCRVTFKKTKAMKMHYVRIHMDKKSLFTTLGDNSCKCISCEKVFTANTVVYHVASCSNLSPFCDNDALCHYVPMPMPLADADEEDMVLNQADFFHNLPDVGPDELDELIRRLNDDHDDDYKEYDDIPSDIEDELRQMYA